MSKRTPLLIAIVLVLTGSASASENNGLTFHLAQPVAPGSGICAAPKKNEFKFLGAPLLTAGDVIKASLFLETRDLTNEKLVKVEMPDNAATEVTTWGKEAGHEVKFSHYGIQFSLSEAGAANFAKGYRGNFGKWIVLKMGDRIIQSTCIREVVPSDSSEKPSKQISLTLGSKTTEAESKQLLNEINRHLKSSLGK